MLHQHQAGEETLVALCPDIEPDVLHPDTLPDAPTTTFDALRGLAMAMASLLTDADDLEDGRHSFTLTFDLSDGRVEAVALSPAADAEDEDDLEDLFDVDDSDDEDESYSDREEEEGEEEDEDSGLSAEDEAYVSDHAARFAAAIARQFDVDESSLAAQVFDLTVEALADDED